MQLSNRSLKRWLTRRRILAVAAVVVALLTIPIGMFIRIEASLREFYGKGGVLDRENIVMKHLADGMRAMAKPDPIAAERHYRSAVEEADRGIGWPTPYNHHILLPPSARALEGLGDALAAQGRTSEAELYYHRSIDRWHNEVDSKFGMGDKEESDVRRKIRELERGSSSVR